MVMVKSQKGFHLLPLLIVVVLVCVGAIGWRVMQKNNDKNQAASSDSKKLGSQEKQWLKDCQGDGRVQMQKSPMNLEDVGMILPLGLTAGAHVTPIDHLYFSPLEFRSPRDKYPVYAMADGYIVEITSRSVNVDTGQARPPEYRFMFQHSCQTISYFDLVTSVDDSIIKQMPDIESKGRATGHIAVKAGQLIGRIGGQTLDTAVYNMDLVLPGFITPSLYDAEPWKVHTDDFFSYFDEPLKSQLLDKNIRKTPPYSGKIDYDQPGKLIGNWFKQGSNGYAGEKGTTGAGENGRGYWSGHLSVFYHAIQPATIIVSLGEFSDGSPEAFAVAGNTPDPASVNKASGIVKYELIQGPNQDGQLPQDKTVRGSVLLQVLDGEKLKMEVFPGKTASQVNGFTPAALTYER
ncbi:hypothetical protein HYS42_01720 [Candidatus Saccharibacteria bacterium]|nr:hypothetical protein [Candidatus Saccharibacteria bacterium]